MDAPAHRAIYCGYRAQGNGPAPEAGGFVTGTRAVVESALLDHTMFEVNPYTHKGDGSLARRFFEDLRRFRASLRKHEDHPLVMMQLCLYLSIYREFAMGRMAVRAGRRLVLDLRGGNVLRFLERDANRLQRQLFGRLVAVSDLALVQCAGFLPELRRRYPRARFEWFPNFVPGRRIAPRGSPSYQHGETLRLVYFGHYRRDKGILELLEAVERLRRERRARIELHMAGVRCDPDVTARLDACDPSAVADHGLLEPGALFPLLDQMHVFVFPTSHFGEGHPNSVNEALMSGLAIVATRHGQLPQILPEKETLWLDQTRLVESLMEKIVLLSDHPELVNRISTANQRYLRENFTDARWIPFLESRLDELLAE